MYSYNERMDIFNKQMDELDKFVKNYEKVIEGHLNDQSEQIKLIVAKNNRERSDLQTMNIRQLNRIDFLQKKVEEFNESIESLCTLVLCLTESQSMQLRSEEQDDYDKMDIAMIGKREKGDPLGEVTKEDIMLKLGGRFPEFPEQVGSKERNENRQKDQIIEKMRSGDDKGLELPQHLLNLKSSLQG